MGANMDTNEEQKIFYGHVKDPKLFLVKIFFVVRIKS